MELTFVGDATKNWACMWIAEMERETVDLSPLTTQTASTD